MSHEVYIAYSHKDTRVAEAVTSSLERNGICVFIAPRDVKPGTSWIDTVVEAIVKSKLIVIVLSDAADSSDDITLEIIDLANRRNLPIITFLTEGTAPNGALASQLAAAPTINSRSDQPIDLYLEQLVESVKAVLANKSKNISVEHIAKPKPLALDPIGFWSYGRHDDEHSDGALSALRVRVGKELKLLYGEDVDIFLDSEAISFGATWNIKISEAIGKTTFFIPIVTPRFFKSENCIDELNMFREREKILGRNDLIFPLQYINISDLRPNETPFPKELEFIKSRQIFDFESYRCNDLKEKEVQNHLNKFATTIRRTLRSGAEKAM
jgi:TIR domain